jgi:alpha-L-fucosidase
MLNLHAPESDDHIQQVKAYIENDPIPEYAHAPLSAMEAFQDLKFGVRIHWGLYSLWHLQDESWPVLKMPLRKRQEYQELFKSFNPVGFDANAWMDFFQRSGLKCFAFTTKHHEGFSLFDTRTRVKQRVNWTDPDGPRIEACDLAYSVAETPFQRDIVAELCAAARSRDIKIDLYYSHPDWYDADFRPYGFHPLQTPRVSRVPWEYGAPQYHQSLRKRAITWEVDDRSPLETARMVQRHRDQLVELFTHYGKIDMLCLDMWLGADIWPQVRETILLIRQIQPDVMVRIRGIGNYGDYYTPEGFVPGDKANTDMPWMVIYPLARSFSYDPVGLFYKGTAWIIRNLIRSVAKGGNFMVGIGPDENGRFHPQAIKDLERAGAWLKINGEAIYATRACDPWHEGDEIFFTRSKDGRNQYTLCLKWPGKSLRLKSISPQPDLKVILLGVDTPLAWHPEGQDVVVEIPAGVKPLSWYASVFKFVQPA